MALRLARTCVVAGLALGHLAATNAPADASTVRIVASFEVSYKSKTWRQNAGQTSFSFKCSEGHKQTFGISAYRVGLGKDTRVAYRTFTGCSNVRMGWQAAYAGNYYLVFTKANTPSPVIGSGTVDTP